MKRFLPILILLAVVLFYTKPYFRTGFFTTHDGEWAVIRLSEMQRELKDSQFPPRFADYLNHGFGYPLFSYTYPGPFYLGTILRIFRIGLVDSVKVIFVGSVVMSAIFMFLLGRELAGDFAGFLAALFYIVAPFRLVDLYIRGSIGESLSLALFPMLFYLSLKYILNPNITRMILCSLVFAFLILTHNIMALVFFPIWIAFLFVSVLSYFEDIKLYSWRYFLPMILLGIGLSAYFFIPAIFEKQYIVLSQIKLANISEHFISLPDYLLSPWSYGPKPSYQLGWAHILGALLGLAGVFMAKEIYRKKYLPIALFISFSIGILVFLAHPTSSDFWNAPPLSWIDFPWRFLTPISFLLALASIFLSIHRITRIIGGILVAATIIFSLNFARPAEYINKPDVYYATNDATTTSMDELMPVWVANKPTQRYKTKVELEHANATVYNLDYNSRSIKFRVVTKVPNIIKVNTVYFPGWQFFLKGEQIPLNFGSPDGLIRFEVPEGNHFIEGKFVETKVRFWSDMVSLLSLAAAVGLLVYSLILRLKTRTA
ncbi:hypothetical protein HZB96_05790 [Candidatus Gottesmanbacteria bacterium]|nr:hypothetical protein [Candidatus Gottesmanbacteria bacterium]